MGKASDYNYAQGRLDYFNGRDYSTIKFVSVKSGADLDCPHCGNALGLKEFVNNGQYECLKCKGNFVLTVDREHPFQYCAATKPE